MQNFEDLQTLQPFRLEHNQTDPGWFLFTRLIWNTRATGGQWMAQGTYMFLFLVLFLSALCSDLLIYIVFKTLQGIWFVAGAFVRSVFKVAMQSVIAPIFRLLAIGVALLIMYTVYKSGAYVHIIEIIENIINRLPL